MITPPPKNKPRLKLVGEDGNAFGILGRARHAAKRAGWTEDQVKQFLKAATSADYTHLLKTCTTYFEVY